MYKKALEFSRSFLDLSRKIEIEDYIDGDKFVSIADFAFTEFHRTPDISVLERSGIIFCKTDYLFDLFRILKNCSNDYVLITHNSDHQIDENVYGHKPKCIRTWFAQNCIVDKQDIIPIPIGLEREHVSKGRKSHRMLQDQIRNNKSLNRKIYCNFNFHTNIRERRLLWYVFRLLPFTTYKNKISYTEFLSDIFNHRYILSPPGNGVDCHRTWEALYLGSLPIVKNGKYLRSFSGLPLYSYNGIFDITLSRLDKWVSEISEEALDIEKLKFSYWNNLILNTFQNG